MQRTRKGIVKQEAIHDKLEPGWSKRLAKQRVLVEKSADGTLVRYSKNQGEIK